MADTEDRPAKRVLAVGAQDSVLDLASDPKSRFFGVPRDMLCAMLLGQYLLSVCHKCRAPHALPAYWLERDHTRTDPADNEGRELVFLCSMCAEAESHCVHCLYMHVLYDMGVPLALRPPVFEFTHGRDATLVAAQCMADALARPACRTCGVPDFSTKLYIDSRTSTHMCAPCMKEQELAPCGSCYNTVYAGREYCDFCALGDPTRNRAVARCAAAHCFELTDVAGTRCAGCQMVHEAIWETAPDGSESD